MAQLRRIHPAVRDRGADLVVVGNGSVEQARRFVDEQSPPFPVWTDPSGRTYDETGMLEGLWRAVEPRSFAAARRARREGFRQAGIQGQPLRLGGVLIVLPDGRVPWRHSSRFAGDHPEPERVLEALDEVLPAPAPPRIP